MDFICADWTECQRLRHSTLWKETLRSKLFPWIGECWAFDMMLLRESTDYGEVALQTRGLVKIRSVPAPGACLRSSGVCKQSDHVFALMTAAFTFKRREARACKQK
jgi:hypothetical protein